MKAVVILLFVLAACAQPQAPARAAAGPEDVPMPRVVFPNGYAVHVELAIDDATRAQGLMFRDRLPEDRGMLFVFANTSVHSFWMKNTLIPLDMIWIDQQRRVVHVKHDVPPCRADPCPGYGPGVPANYVLEVAGGVARRQGVEAGAQLGFEGLDHIMR